MTGRKIDAMHKRYGTVDEKCKVCRWLLRFDYHGKRYYKCKLYGVSHSEATDWRLSYQACGALNIPEDELDAYSPYLMQIIRERNAEPPLEGQISLFS